MNVIVDLCLVPIGIGVDLAPSIATCQRVLRERGVEHTLHSAGTTIEGDWEAVMGAVRACHERLHADGVPRIHSTMRVGTRTDRVQRAAEKVTAVERLLD
jgi:uncharacterized protein (TIGR00106 family)